MSIGAAISGIGVGMQAIGSYASGKAAKREAYRQAKLARQEGIEAKTLADYETRIIYEAGAETLGAIEAETGKSGLALSGTSLAHLVRTARKIELTAALKQREGRVTQYRYQQQSQVGLAAGQDAYTAGILQGLGALAQIGKIDFSGKAE